jgi:hypothetical protein
MSEGKNSGVRWQAVQHNGSLQDFAARNSLNPEALRLAANEVVVLPRNRELADVVTDQHLFVANTKEVMLVLRGGGLSARLYDDGGKRRELVLKSADILFPLLLFAGNAAASLAFSVLGNWIYEKWVNKPKAGVPSIKLECAVIDENGDVKRWRRLEGPADEVHALLLEESRLLQGATEKPQTPKTDTANDSPDPWRGDRAGKEAKKSLARANKLIEQAKRAYARRQAATAESLYRKSLEMIREACLWEPAVGSHREYLHRIGRLVHDTFGCQLPFRDGQYWVTCPVQLSHNRIGLSIGGSATVICSICGEDSLLCPHVKGRRYNGIVAARHRDYCNICARTKCCHKVGKSYNHVEAIGIVTDINLDHVALVKNPAHPLCVVNAHALAESDVSAALPPEERGSLDYGNTIIHCHHCVICTGSETPTRLQ